MEKIDFEGVNLAELLPRIPATIRNGLPFGLVKLDLTGKILECNMAEGDLTGVDPAWALGKNFFDEVALCTKTQAFYGRFVEGVKRGFMNAVFDFTFDHREIATNVKVHMFTMPDSRGMKTVMLLVKRSDRPVIMDAIAEVQTGGKAVLPSFQDTKPGNSSNDADSAKSAPSTMQDIVNAVITAMNQSLNTGSAQAPGAVAPPAVAPPVSQAVKSRHEDILKF